MASTYFTTEEVSDYERLSMRNNNQLDYMVCHLTAHELIVAFHRHFHLLRENVVASIKPPGSRWIYPIFTPFLAQAVSPARNSRNV
jgi:hypothetical protein